MPLRGIDVGAQHGRDLGQQDVAHQHVTSCPRHWPLRTTARAPHRSSRRRTHAEIDRLWNAIVSNGGQESACGWCSGKWGLSWQITPRALAAAATDPDRATAKRAFEAMMQIGKIDIAPIEAARRG